MSQLDVPPSFADEEWQAVDITLEYADPLKKEMQSRTVTLDRAEMEVEANRGRAEDAEPVTITPQHFKSVCVSEAKNLLEHPVLVREPDGVRFLPPWNIMSVTVSRAKTQARIYVPS